MVNILKKILLQWRKFKKSTLLISDQLISTFRVLYWAAHAIAKPRLYENYLFKGSRYKNKIILSLEADLRNIEQLQLQATEIVDQLSYIKNTIEKSRVWFVAVNEHTRSRNTVIDQGITGLATALYRLVWLYNLQALETVDLTTRIDFAHVSMSQLLRRVRACDSLLQLYVIYKLIKHATGRHLQVIEPMLKRGIITCKLASIRANALEKAITLVPAIELATSQPLKADMWASSFDSCRRYEEDSCQAYEKLMLSVYADGVNYIQDFNKFFSGHVASGNAQLTLKGALLDPLVDITK